VCNMLNFCGFQLCMPPSRAFHVDGFLTDFWRAGLDSQSKTDRRSSGNFGIFEAKSVCSEGDILQEVVFMGDEFSVDISLNGVLD
jgi:hypothetical protein